MKSTTNKNVYPLLLIIVLVLIPILFSAAVIANPPATKPVGIEEIALPKGTYYIGDLCYVVTQEWPELVSLYFQKQKENPNANLHNLTKAIPHTIVFNTGSDGNYWLKNKTNPTQQIALSVDSGTIGLIDIKLLDKKVLEENLHLGHVKEFKSDFTVSFNDDKISIENLEIELDQEEDQEEYEEKY